MRPNTSSPTLSVPPRNHSSTTPAKSWPSPRGNRNPESILLVGKKSVAVALIRHFRSLKGLARASFQELRQFLPRRQAESVVAALSMFVMAETEHARSEQLDNPESIYRVCEI